MIIIYVVIKETALQLSVPILHLNQAERFDIASELIKNALYSYK